MSNRTIVISVLRIATEEVLTGTDQGSVYAYYQVPEGIAVSLGSVTSPLLGNYPRYRGNVSALSTDCGITPPGTSADPVWNGSWVPMGYVDNQPYEQYIPFSALTPAAGKTIVDIVKDGLQSFLTIQPGGANGVYIRGSVPAGYAELSFSLLGKQSDGRTAIQPFTAYPLSTSVYAASSFNSAQKRLTLFVGADSAGAPAITLLYAPESYSKGGTYNMDRGSTTNLNGLPHPFSFNYGGIITGQYIGKIVWLNQTRYFTLDVLDSYTNAVEALNLTGSASLPSMGYPAYDGSIELFDEAPGTNPAPVLINPQPDVTITTAEAYPIAPPQNEFGDNAGDTARIFGYLLDKKTNGELPLPLGITYDASTGVFVVAADFANQSLTLRRKYIDSADQFMVDDFEVVVNRQTTTPPAANTVQYVQAQFVANYYGSGVSNDLLEIQMMDTYPDQPMYIAVQLSSQAAPTSGFALFQRAGSIRDFKLASGQNLKNKNFKIYISTSSTGTNLRTLSFATSTTSSSGFVTLN